MCRKFLRRSPTCLVVVGAFKWIYDLQRCRESLTNRYRLWKSWQFAIHFILLRWLVLGLRKEMAPRHMIKYQADWFKTRETELFLSLPCYFLLRALVLPGKKTCRKHSSTSSFVAFKIRNFQISACPGDLQLRVGGTGCTLGFIGQWEFIQIVCPWELLWICMEKEVWRCSDRFDWSIAQLLNLQSCFKWPYFPRKTKLWQAFAVVMMEQYMSQLVPPVGARNTTINSAADSLA